MANIPPVAALSLIPTAITLPANVVTLDASASSDPNANGVIVNYKFFQNGEMIGNTPNSAMDQIFQTAGTYTIKVICTDRGGLTDDDTKTLVVSEAAIVTKWGAIIADGSPDSDIIVLNKLGCTCSRHSVELSTYNGHDNMFEKEAAAGIKSIVNLNWKTVSSNGGNPNFFVLPSQYTKYKEKINAYLTDYHPELVVIENEPTTDLFFKGAIQPYIDQLAFAVPIVHQHNVKVTDGGIHTPFIEQVIAANGGPLSGNAKDVRSLIEAFITIPTDFVNIHTNSKGASVPLNFVSKSADYVRTICKKEIMSNEWHIAKPSPTSMMPSFIAAWKAAKPVYCLIYSSGSGKNEPISVGSNLNAMGIAYRDAIA